MARDTDKTYSLKELHNSIPVRGVKVTDPDAFLAALKAELESIKRDLRGESE